MTGSNRILFAFALLQLLNELTTAHSLGLLIQPEPCLVHLKDADLDGDGTLSRVEYLAFLRLEGRTEALRFEQLDLEHVTRFYSNACLQCYRESQQEDCCVGEKAHIDIENNAGSVLLSLCPMLGEVGMQVEK